MALATRPSMTARNPATGAALGEVPVTSPDEVAEAVARARAAQPAWAEAGWPARRAFLKRWWAELSRDADGWADAIRDEIGKPRAEALAGDVVSTLDALRWTVRHGGKALAPGSLGAGHQALLLMPRGRLTHRPFGVVGVIGTWNYPLFLNAPVIAHALAAGNAVVWKPSELAPGVGLRLQRSLEAAGLPEGLVTAVIGGAEVGQALVGSEIDKGVFTGGVENGRRVAASLAERGVPLVAELSGFDPALVLPDAPRASTLDALCWGSFVGAGQTCVTVKRVYVVGDPTAWAAGLASRADALRVGDPADPATDIGPLIAEAARDRCHARVLAALGAGAGRLAGAEFAPGPGWFYRPTVLRADTPEAEAPLAGVFGPVVVVRGFPDVDSAVAGANASEFALAASVWSRDLGTAGAVAARLNVGTVNVNDAVTTAMHASAPFGGNKASGFGRTHGAFGVREFTQTHVVFERRPGGFRPQLFPYGVHPVERFMSLYRRLFHPAR